MEIGFDNLLDHVIPMDSFKMKWRFTDPDYAKLPSVHLNQIKPLDYQGSKFLWDFVLMNNLHQSIPFTSGYFNRIECIKIYVDNEKEIRKWLYKRGLLLNKTVLLSYQPDTAIIVPWKLLIKYFDDFYYSDDLTVIDQSLNWTLLFFHEGEIYFGTNENIDS